MISVRLFLGATNTDDTSRIIFESGGDFKAGVDHSFIATFNNEPTAAPVIDGDSFLTLELRFDLYPEELGLQLRMRNSETAVERQNNREDSIIFFRPPRYYASYVDQSVVETIPIPTSSPGASRDYSLIVTDRYVRMSSDVNESGFHSSLLHEDCIFCLSNAIVLVCRFVPQLW